jgi:hypothetical protein
VATSAEAVTVSKLTLQRDAAKFRLDGNVTFLAAVDGKVTGAVFTGDGIFTITPPLPQEERTLALLTKSSEFVERFNTAVFRFTDDTYAEIRKAGTPAAAEVSAANALDRSRDAARKMLHLNLSARVLQDLLSSSSGLFIAFIDGRNYSHNMLFIVDPFGVAITGEAEYSALFFPQVAPEEIALLT